MQLEARVLVQPRLDLRRLVGGIVVEDQMDIAPRWHSLVDTRGLSSSGTENLGRGFRHVSNGWYAPIQRSSSDISPERRSGRGSPRHQFGQHEEGVTAQHI